MSRLDGRLDRLEHLTGQNGQRVVVWTQASDGSDRFTSTQHPGLTLTAAALDELPTDDRPGAGVTIVVLRYAAARPAGSTL